MQRIVYLILMLCISSQLFAEDIERLTQTSCAYQAGTAREIQLIRQTEGDDWPAFKQNVMKIYSESQGRADLLVIAKNVYLQPLKISAQQIHDITFEKCVVRAHGNEPSA